MKTFTNKKGISYLLFDVPNGARDFKVFNDEQPYLSYFKGVETPREYLPQGNYELIGLAKDVSEHQSDLIVDGMMAGSWGVWYVDYLANYEKFAFDTATESLSSLVQSLGLNNPIILRIL